MLLLLLSVASSVWTLRSKCLRQLAVENLVDGFASKHLNFCEPCTEGKHHCSPFPVGGGKRAGELLDLVHSDVCGN